MRRIALVAVLIAGCAILAGTASARRNHASNAVTITWWDWGSNDQAIIDTFEKTHPNINVVAQNVGQGPPEYAKLLTAIAAGSGAPDLVQLGYPLLTQFIATGGIRNLSPLGAAKYKSLFPTGAWNLVTSGKGIYGLPVDTGPLALFYNKTIFARYGLTVPKTWAQFQADGAKLHKQNPSIYMSFLDTSSGEAELFMSLASQAGAVPFVQTGPKSWRVNLASPAMLKVAQYWQGLVNSGLAKHTQIWSDDWIHDIGVGNYAAFAGAQWSTSYELAPYITNNTDWAVAPLPQWTPGSFVTATGWGGSTFAVPSQSQHPAQALEFAKWVTTTSQGIRWQATSSTSGGRGTWPAAIAAKTAVVLNAPVPALGGQMTAKIFSQSSSAAPTKFQWGPWVTYFDDQFGTEGTKAANGAETWKQALLNVQNAIAAYGRQQGFKVTTG